MSAIAEFGTRCITEFAQKNLKLDAVIVSSEMEQDFMKILHEDCFKVKDGNIYLHNIRVWFTPRLPVNRNLFLVHNHDYSIDKCK